jgi:dTMP kinase
LDRAWRRINGCADDANESRFEQETLAFHQKVRDGYLALARQEPDRIRIVDADNHQDHIAREIERLLTACFSHP